jgi:hypothetical protein
VSAWRDVLRHLFPDRVGPLLDPPWWQLAAEDRAKALMADRELYMDPDKAMGLHSDCDWWQPCSKEDNWLCRVHCGKCMPMSPCLGHDRVWAAAMNKRLGVTK